MQCSRRVLGEGQRGRGSNAWVELRLLRVKEEMEAGGHPAGHLQL